MMRSLYSGVSGLRVHQTKMDVIGNNIANVNTVGFKSSSVSFSDFLYQTTQSATGPNGETGAAGQNAKQIGLGVNLASIKTSITKTGGSQRTDDPLDIMINGNSFFIVKNGGANYFTKAGTFGLDASGTLSTPSGAAVMGWQVDPKDPNKIIKAEVSELRIKSPENLTTPPEATTDTYITGNIDKNDTQIAPAGSGKTINMSFYDSMGYSYTADIKVNQSKAATNIYDVAVNDIRDSDGQSIFVKKNETTGKFEGSGITQFTFQDTKYDAKVDENTGVVTLTPNGTVLPVQMQFNSASGKFEGIGTGNPIKGTEVYLQVNSTATAANTNPFEKINIDFSSVTMYAKSESSALESQRGSLESLGTLGGGKKVGNMIGTSIDTTGKIYGKYDNGDTKLLGQIAVAEFANPSGLEAVGNSMFTSTLNSGDFDGVGKDISENGGEFTPGVLEMSNVDLSAEFTEMITTQRGFQANSRIITTSDTLLEELINLKR